MRSRRLPDLLPDLWLPRGHLEQAPIPLSAGPGPAGCVDDHADARAYGVAVRRGAILAGRGDSYGLGGRVGAVDGLSGVWEPRADNWVFGIGDYFRLSAGAVVGRAGV